MKIRFGIVGCGMIARFHAAALLEIQNTQITVLQSRSKANAEKLAAAVGISPRICSTMEELVQDDVDAVIICTPSGNHLEPARIAAQAGKHIVVEKPLEITEERCDQLIAACDEAGVKLCTIFPSRFVDANMELKRAVDSGRFGRLTLGETTCKWWRSQDYYDEGGWKGTLALDGGGALMNQAIHNVDLLQWMMGDVDSVAAFTSTLAHDRIEVEDTAVACLRFRIGALGVIQAATSIHPGLPKTIAIHGNAGTVVVEQEDILRWDFQKTESSDEAIRKKFAQKLNASGGSSNPAAISHEYHRRQLTDFVDSILKNRPPAVDGREGKKAVAIIRAIYRSAQSGRIEPVCYNEMM